MSERGSSGQSIAGEYNVFLGTVNATGIAIGSGAGDRISGNPRDDRRHIVEALHALRQKIALVDVSDDERADAVALIESRLGRLESYLEDPKLDRERIFRILSIIGDVADLLGDAVRRGIQQLSAVVRDELQ